MKNAIVRLRGPSASVPVRELLESDPRTMSDFDAGVQFAAIINTVHPNASWRSLMAQYNQRVHPLGKSWFSEYILDPVKSVTIDPLKDAFSEVITGVSDRGSAVIDKLTSEKLIDNVNKAFKGFTDGGGVMGAIGTNKFADVFSNSGGLASGTSGENQDFVSMIGGLWKKAFGGNVAGGAVSTAGVMNSTWLWLGAAGVGMWLLFRGGNYKTPRRRRRAAKRG